LRWQIGVFDVPDGSDGMLEDFRLELNWLVGTADAAHFHPVRRAMHYQ
jgi:hypothetical protein